MAAPFRRWLEKQVAEGLYFGFMAEQADVVIGGVGLMELSWPPHPLHPADDRRGYVLNLFVEQRCRRAGVAAILMEAAEREFTRRGITYVVLHASEAGRPLYTRAGWARSWEMEKHLRAAPAE